MHYVGMDCHITTLDFAVVDDAGRLVKSCKVDTSAKNFMEFVKSVAAPRIVYMEESALAAWALETCIRFGEKLVITDPKQNHWIGSSTQKDDQLDAFKLAQLGRGGFIKILTPTSSSPWWGSRLRFQNPIWFGLDCGFRLFRLRRVHFEWFGWQGFSFENCF